MTNLEKIQKMSADDIAAFLRSIASCGGIMCGNCEAKFLCEPSKCFGEDVVEILNMEVNE